MKNFFLLVRAGGLALMLVMIRIHNWNKKRNHRNRGNNKKGGRVHHYVCFFYSQGVGKHCSLPKGAGSRLAPAALPGDSFLPRMWEELGKKMRQCGWLFRGGKLVHQERGARVPLNKNEKCDVLRENTYYIHI